MEETEHCWVQFKNDDARVSYVSPSKSNATSPSQSTRIGSQPWGLYGGTVLHLPFLASYTPIAVSLAVLPSSYL